VLCGCYGEPWIKFAGREHRAFRVELGGAGIAGIRLPGRSAGFNREGVVVYVLHDGEGINGEHRVFGDGISIKRMGEDAFWTTPAMSWLIKQTGCSTQVHPTSSCRKALLSVVSCAHVRHRVGR
jgi:hypothetical protein